MGEADYQQLLVMECECGHCAGDHADEHGVCYVVGCRCLAFGETAECLLGS